MIKMIKYALVIIWICGFTNSIYGQNTYTLNEAVHYALQHHKSINNAHIDIEIANKRVKEILAIGLPQVSSDVKFQNFIQIPTTVVPASAFDPMAPEDEVAELKFGTEYNLTAGVQLSQLIFNGSYIVGLQATKAFQETTQIMLTKTKQDVRESVSTAYYTVAMLESNLSAIKKQRTSIQKIYNETNILVEEGILERTSPLQLKLSIVQMDAGIQEIERQLEVAKILLKVNMGYDLDSEINLTESLDIFYNQIVGSDIDTVLNTNKNISSQLLHHQYKLDELNFKNEVSKHLPTMSGFISHQQQAQRNEFDFANTDKSWYPTTLWGVNLNIPLWTSGSTRAKIQQAKLKTDKTEINIHLLNDGLKLQYQKAFNDYKSALDMYYSQKEIISISQEVLEASNIKLKEGVITSMEYTQAQGQLLKAEADIINTTYKLLNAKLSMDIISNN